MSSVSNIDIHEGLYNEFDEGTEDLEQYRSGGLPVIQIGATFKQGRYKIVHKLGHGATSTVWLAFCKVTNELVTIKALTATASSESTEAALLSRFSSQTGIRKLVDKFEELGPNGRHSYLVLEPALCSIFAAKEASYFRPIPLATARTIAADLVATVQHLHSNGVVHSDIHTGNILLRLPDDMRKLSPSDLYKKIGRPMTEVVKRRDGASLPLGVPTELVWPARLEVQTTGISSSQHLPTMLSDFGESFEPHLTKRDQARTRPTLVPPESFFAQEGDSAISFPADVWTLGCTIVEIMGGGAPFDTWPDPDSIISEHVMVLGRLPNPWWSEWSARSQFFNDDATIYLPEGRALDDNIEKRYKYCVVEPRLRFGEELPEAREKRAFLEMLSTMLTYHPDKRSTIDQIAGCEWIQRWAIPIV